jgi:hypothetical protein
MKHELAWPFFKPVSLDAVPGYLDSVSTPMDLGTVKQKLKSYGDKHQDFASDVRLVWSNCQAYNEDTLNEDSEWAQIGRTMAEFFEGLYGSEFGNATGGEAPPKPK